MNDEAFKIYIDGRFADALAFYDNRAKMYKKWYRALSVYVLFVSLGLTPFVSFAGSEEKWRIWAALFSASIAAATGLLAFYKCQENWLSYRASWDALKREREFHNAGINDYKSAADRNALFVERVELILTREGTDFYARHLKSDDQVKPPTKKIL